MNANSFRKIFANSNTHARSSTPLLHYVSLERSTTVSPTASDNLRTEYSCGHFCSALRCRDRNVYESVAFDLWLQIQFFDKNKYSDLVYFWVEVMCKNIHYELIWYFATCDVRSQSSTCILHSATLLSGSSESPNRWWNMNPWTLN